MEDFSIQFSEEVRSVCQRRWKSYQNARPGKLHPLTRDTDNFIFPRKFRELRALAIACWYLPDWLKWEIILYLNDLVYSIDFEHNGLVQSTELRVLVSRKKILRSSCRAIIIHESYSERYYKKISRMHSFPQNIKSKVMQSVNLFGERVTETKAPGDLPTAGKRNMTILSEMSKCSLKRNVYSLHCSLLSIGTSLSRSEGKILWQGRGSWATVSFRKEVFL